MIMRDLTDKVAWITGAGTGIGEAGAIALTQAGMKVVISGRRLDKLEAVAAQCHGQATIEVLDVSSKEDVQAVVDRIVAKFGRVAGYENAR